MGHVFGQFADSTERAAGGLSGMTAEHLSCTTRGTLDIPEAVLEARLGRMTALQNVGGIVMGDILWANNLMGVRVYRARSTSLDRR